MNLRLNLKKRSHLKHIVGLLAEGPVVLVRSLAHGALQVGEERPDGVVAVLDVAAQRQRSVCPQKTHRQLCVLVRRRLARCKRRWHYTCEKMNIK